MNRRPIPATETERLDDRRLPTVSIVESILGETPRHDDPVETFHEASRTYPGVLDPNVRGIAQLETSNEMRMSATRSTKRYPTASAVQLPTPSLGAVLLSDALLRRRSRRSSDSRRITLAELGTLLGAAYGISGNVKGAGQMLRTAPSGGALYPLELYVAARLVEGLDEALFHYDPLRHVLERVRALDAGRELEPLTSYPEWVRGSAALIVTTAVFWRSRFKYGARAYRFTLLEAGHVGQNLLLAATALDLDVVPIGGFYDRRVDSFLGADGLHEATVYVFPVAARA